MKKAKLKILLVAHVDFSEEVVAKFTKDALRGEGYKPGELILADVSQYGGRDDIALYRFDSTEEK